MIELLEANLESIHTLIETANVLVVGQPGTGLNWYLHQEYPDAVVFDPGIPRDLLELFEFFETNRNKLIIIDSAFYFKTHINTAELLTAIIKSLIDGKCFALAGSVRESFDFTGQIILTSYTYDCVPRDLINRMYVVIA